MSISDKVSVVIPTYRRGTIVLDTVRKLRSLPELPSEILLVDQTEDHPPEVLEVFQWLQNPAENLPNSGRSEAEISKGWNKSFQTLRNVDFRWLRLSQPSIPHAMNVGLQEAKGEVVLFLDDDIIPDDQLASKHGKAHEEFPEACAVVGQVLQPEEGFQVSDVGLSAKALATAGGQRSEVRNRRSGSSLCADLDFKFNSSEPTWVENIMAGNLSVKRAFALRVGGFDEKFIPPVSFRFETEFAKRLVASGGCIRFEPAASIRHLRAGQGGTRSRGSHLTSASPLHGVGDYYYALRRGRGIDRAAYMLKRPFREVFTRFHRTHPWYIPIKFIGELRAMGLAFKLARNEPGCFCTKGNI